jgi:hypothetical protein
LITLIHEISHLVAFENLEEILNLMVMNGSILWLMIPYIHEKFSKSAASFIGKTFQKPTASSDTDTTLSLALKQFDAQNDKTIYLRYLWGVFRIDSGRFFKNGCTG